MARADAAVEVVLDPFPSDEALRALWLAAWGEAGPAAFGPILARGLVHVGALRDGRLVGFVHVAWDGGRHAFLLDTCVAPEVRRRGVATALVRRAVAAARDRGAHWLHVDYEPHLDGFHRACGFRPTLAGLIRLGG